MPTILLKPAYGFLEAEDEISQTLLRHVAEGQESVAKDDFEAEYKPLIEAHGWTVELLPADKE